MIRSLRRISWGKVALFLISLFLFVFAILLMKEGARALAPWVRDQLLIRNPANALGFGWLFAYLVLSGSPVAAATLTFMDAGIVDAANGFLMIIGSRLGSSFIVLLLGFLYVLRGRDRETSLGMGFLSLTVTAVINLSAIVIGLPLLRSNWLAGFELGGGGAINSIIDNLFGPLLQWTVGLLPEWALFVAGLLIIIGSFTLFDRSLPTMSIKQSQIGRVSRLVYRPLVMFAFGAGITVISMSVSVSLALLVPLSARGFVRRENVIPYIMGANVTTFIDTVLAAALLQNPVAVIVVLACMISAIVISLLIMLVGYSAFSHACLNLVAWLLKSDRSLLIATVVIVLLPIALLLI